MKRAFVVTIISFSFLGTSVKANELENRLGLREAFEYCGMLSASIPTPSLANPAYKEYEEVGCMQIVDKYVELNPFAYNEYVNQHGFEKIAKECKKMKPWMKEFLLANLYKESYEQMECNKVLEAVNNNSK
jgi:hypothetical protein